MWSKLKYVYYFTYNIIFLIFVYGILSSIYEDTGKLLAAMILIIYFDLHGFGKLMGFASAKSELYSAKQLIDIKELLGKDVIDDRHDIETATKKLDGQYAELTIGGVFLVIAWIIALLTIINVIF